MLSLFTCAAHPIYKRDGKLYNVLLHEITSARMNLDNVYGGSAALFTLRTFFGCVGVQTRILLCMCVVAY